MKRYTVDWRSGVLRDENNAILDLDWVKQVCLADEVDAELAKKDEEINTLKDICDEKEMELFNKGEEIARLRGLLDERKKWRAEHFVADVNRWLDKVDTLLAPEKEKGK